MAAMLGCKFRLVRVLRDAQGSRKVVFVADQKDGDDTEWSKWTPTGELAFDVTNPAAVEEIDAMQIGDQFYLDLSPAPVVREPAPAP